MKSKFTSQFFCDLVDRLMERFANVFVQKLEEKLLHPNFLLQMKTQREAADYAASNMQAALAMWRR